MAFQRKKLKLQKLSLKKSKKNRNLQTHCKTDYAEFNLRSLHSFGDHNFKNLLKFYLFWGKNNKN